MGSRLGKHRWVLSQLLPHLQPWLCLNLNFITLWKSSVRMGLCEQTPGAGSVDWHPRPHSNSWTYEYSFAFLTVVTIMAWVDDVVHHQSGSLLSQSRSAWCT